jgi:hypothetical protein
LPVPVEPKTTTGNLFPKLAAILIPILIIYGSKSERSLCI